MEALIREIQSAMEGLKVPELLRLIRALLASCGGDSDKMYEQLLQAGLWEKGVEIDHIPNVGEQMYEFSKTLDVKIVWLEEFTSDREYIVKAVPGVDIIVTHMDFSDDIRLGLDAMNFDYGPLGRPEHY